MHGHDMTHCPASTGLQYLALRFMNVHECSCKKKKKRKKKIMHMRW